MLAWLTNVVGQALSILLSGGSNDNLALLRDALVNVWTALRAIVKFLQDVLGGERQAWLAARPDIETGAQGLGDLADAEVNAWVRLLDHIIPESLAWLDGRTHQWVDAKYDPQLRDLQSRVKDILEWEDVTQHWIDLDARPALADWRNFSTWWAHNFVGPATTLIEWLKHPASFGSWAAAPVAGPLVSYLAAPEHQDVRDKLSVAMVKAWADDPNLTLDAVLEWLVA